MTKPVYRWVLHRDFRQKLRDWRAGLIEGAVTPGQRLKRALKGKDPARMTTPSLFNALMQTKVPTLYAESEVYGDGRDWTYEELSLLGDVTCAVPVTVFDNGRHDNPQIHESPFKATLLFASGPLFRNDKGGAMPDREECVTNSTLDRDAYHGLIHRRLRPLLAHANNVARKAGKKAVVTIPGIGCGQFAGDVQGIPLDLEDALIRLIMQEGSKWTHLSCVYFDTYFDLSPDDHDIKGIKFRVRPLMKVNTPKPQLSTPETYEETPGEFKDHILFSVVAWDPVSWPGNDFYIGNRSTDDGVKAAATDVMTAMTGIKGAYNPSDFGYEPEGYETWEEAIKQNRIQLETEDCCLIETYP